MKYLSTIPKTARRAIAIIAAAAATGLIVAAAVPPSSSALSLRSVALTSDAGHAAVAACSAADLGVWVAVDQGNGAAGSAYFPLQLTNLSGHTCALRGFPGVSAINSDGRQLGSAAGWNHVTPVRTVILAPGATAHTLLQYGAAEVETAPGCGRATTAFELRVYPPGQYSATNAAFDLPVCSHAGPIYLNVEPITAGVGTING